MLTFYPEFEANTDERSEVIFMLDLSNSMRGDSLREAKKIALLALHHLPDNWVFNVVVFGTGRRHGGALCCCIVPFTIPYESVPTRL